MWILKYDTKECICEKNRLMDTENIPVVAKGEGLLGGAG